MIWNFFYFCFIFVLVDIKISSKSIFDYTF